MLHLDMNQGFPEIDLRERGPWLEPIEMLLLATTRTWMGIIPYGRTH